MTRSIDTRPEIEAFLASSPSESTPLLLELARRQARRRRPRDLVGQLERDRFVMPSMLDLRLAHRLDGLALEAASEFEAVLLSPVAPLGTCSVVAPSSQDRTLSCHRGTEVVSDPTNVLALLCARRLAANAGAEPRLCSVHQVLRAQALPPQPGFSRHFRLFVLAEAGAARADYAFEVEAIARQIAAFARLFDSAATLGCTLPDRAFTLLSSEPRAPLAARLRTRLQADFPHIELREQTFSHPYYDGLRVLFGARAHAGDFVPLADTGLFDWMPRLTSDKRTRFVASGVGIQLIPLLFREP